MPRGVKTTTNETAEQREARLKARRDTEDRALRKSLLMNAEKSLKRSRAALDAGDMVEHVKWFEMAVTTLTSYEGVAGNGALNAAQSTD